MATSLSKKLPIACPFCDELAYQERRAHRIVTEQRIYTLRLCPTGHRFWSVEEVPEDQSAIVDEIRGIKSAKDR